MKKFIAMVLAVVSVLSMSAIAFASEPEATVVDSTAWDSVLSALTAQISVSTIVGVLASAITAAIGFVFMWWGVRKLLSTFFSGFRKGRASV